MVSSDDGFAFGHCYNIDYDGGKYTEGTFDTGRWHIFVLYLFENKGVIYSIISSGIVTILIMMEENTLREPLTQVDGTSMFYTYLKMKG